MASVKTEPATHESHALFNMAMELINNRRFDKALKPLKEAVRISPNNPSYLSYLGLCAAHAEDDFESAITLCNRAVSLRPTDPIILVNLGKVYRLMGANERAHQIFLETWQNNKEHPAPATELSRMGIRRPPIFSFLPRSHWVNRYLGIIRAKIERAFK